MDIIFWDFLILYQIFFSPQVKRSVIITNKNGIYEIPNDLRLRPLRKFGKIKQISKLQRIITQCPVPPQTEPPPSPPTPAENHRKTAIPHENQSPPHTPRSRMQTPTRARPTHPRTTADPNAMLTQTLSPNVWSTPRIAICTRRFPNNCNWRLLSACASVWTESFKICKSWALINHVLPQCFRSHWLWLNKSNHRVK